MKAIFSLEFKFSDMKNRPTFHQHYDWHVREQYCQVRRRGGQEGAGAPPAFQLGSKGSKSALFKCNDLFSNC